MKTPLLLGYLIGVVVGVFGVPLVVGLFRWLGRRWAERQAIKHHRAWIARDEGLDR